MGDLSNSKNNMGKKCVMKICGVGKGFTGFRIVGESMAQAHLGPTRSWPIVFLILILISISKLALHFFDVEKDDVERG